jgi:hypothetical protein
MPTLILPGVAILALSYHMVAATKSARARSERCALYASALRASDLEQWHSIDSE